MIDSFSASFGALIAISMVLLLLVVAAGGFFLWLRAALFRFSSFSAKQSEDGVLLEAGFKRAGYGTKHSLGVTQLPPATVVHDSPNAGAYVGRFVDDTEPPGDVRPTTLIALAEHDLGENQRVTASDRSGYVRLATAAETDIGTTRQAARKGQRVEVSVPAGSSLERFMRDGGSATDLWPATREH